MNNGFPPVFINLMMLLLSPIAAMAKTIKNLLSILTGAKKAEGTPKLPATVVITAARIKRKGFAETESVNSTACFIGL